MPAAKKPTPKPKSFAQMRYPTAPARVAVSKGHQNPMHQFVEGAKHFLGNNPYSNQRNYQQQLDQQMKDFQNSAAQRAGYTFNDYQQMIANSKKPKTVKKVK